jgi:hypothetical protein
MRMVEHDMVTKQYVSFPATIVYCGGKGHTLATWATISQV